MADISIQESMFLFENIYIIFWIMFGYFSYLLVDDQATILVEQGHLDASLNTDYNKAAAVQ